MDVDVAAKRHYKQPSVVDKTPHTMLLQFQTDYFATGKIQHKLVGMVQITKDEYQEAVSWLDGCT